MVATSDLDPNTAMRPAELLSGRHEQAANPALAEFGSNYETRDAAEEAIGVKERDAMKGDDANDASRRLRNEHGCIVRGCASCNAPLDLSSSRRIAESGQQLGYRESVIGPGVATDSSWCFGRTVRVGFHSWAQTSNQSGSAK